MLNPSRSLVVIVALVAFAGLVLGLATDVGLFGWSLTVLLVLYLAIAGIAQHVRRRSVSSGRPA